MAIQEEKGKRRTNNVSYCPGPGAYQPSIAAIVRKPPASGLGYGKRGFSIAKINASNVPGPGAYASETRREGPKYGFGSDKRRDKKIEPVPGPGKYTLPSTLCDLPPHEKSKIHL